MKHVGNFLKRSFKIPVVICRFMIVQDVTEKEFVRIFRSHVFNLLAGSVKNDIFKFSNF